MSTDFVRDDDGTILAKACAKALYPDRELPPAPPLNNGLDYGCGHCSDKKRPVQRVLVGGFW